MNKEIEGESNYGDPIRYINPNEDISKELFHEEPKLDEKHKKLMEIEYLLGKNDESADSIINNPPGKKPKKHKKMKKTTKTIIATFVTFAFLLGIFFGYEYFYLGGFGKNRVKTEWGDITLDIPQSEEMVNVLAIGFDEGGYRTDTMMIINFNPKTSNVNLISIPRDTLIGIKGSRMKLNAAFSIGKFDLTIRAIRELSGFPIHYYVAVDTEGFRSVIDALGGVYFDVPRDMKYPDPTQNLYIDLKKGPQLLNGSKAEQLVRYRKYVMGDLDRENVQKDFIKALIQQKLTLTNVTDASKMKALYDTLSAHVKTNLGFNDAMRYFVAAIKIKPESFKTYTLPGVPKNINGVSYYVYNKQESLNLFKQIYGSGTEPKLGLAQGITLYDTNSLGQSASVSDPTKTQTTKTGNQGASKGVDLFKVEKIKINDNKDVPYTEVGKVQPLDKTTHDMINDFELDDQQDANIEAEMTRESSTSTQEDNQDSTTN